MHLSSGAGPVSSGVAGDLASPLGPLYLPSFTPTDEQPGGGTATIDEHLSPAGPQYLPATGSLASPLGPLALLETPPAVEVLPALVAPRVTIARDLSRRARTQVLDGGRRHTGLDAPTFPGWTRLPVVVPGVRVEHPSRVLVLAEALLHTGLDLPVNAGLIRPRVVRGRARPPVHRGRVVLGRAVDHSGFLDPTLRVRPAVVVRGRRVEHPSRVLRVTPRLIDWAKRTLEARGAYRVFGPAVYRIFRSSSAPPVEGDTPWATSSSLPATPTDTFADGTWFVAVSYFNGVLDSGFLPIGANGETYRVLVVSGGAAAGTPPAAPLDVRLEVRAGGVVRVVALYAETGANRATHWAVAYTTNGTTPPEDSPTTTQALRSSGLAVLVLDLPAQAHGTAVKVRVQVWRGTGSPVYSDGSTVLTATADASGPAVVPGVELWRGSLPEEVS